LFAGLFGTRVRYSGVGIAHQIGALVGGGITPVLSSLLLARSGGSPWMVALLITVFSLIAAFAVRAMGKEIAEHAGDENRDALSGFSSAAPLGQGSAGR
jgi:hypothetical protein